MLAALLQAPRALESDLITPADVGGSVAWQSLVLDNQLTPVWGPYAVAAHKQITAQHRVSALREMVQTRTVLGRQSALWVLTGHLTSPMVHLLYPPTQHRPKPQAGTVTHQTKLTGIDVIEIDGVQLTGATRTAVDLAIHVERRHALTGLQTLAQHQLVSMPEVLTRLEQIPGRSRRSESVDLVQWAFTPRVTSSRRSSNQ